MRNVPHVCEHTTRCLHHQRGVAAAKSPDHTIMCKTCVRQIRSPLVFHEFLNSQRDVSHVNRPATRFYLTQLQPKCHVYCCHEKTMVTKVFFSHSSHFPRPLPVVTVVNPPGHFSALYVLLQQPKRHKLCQSEKLTPQSRTDTIRLDFQEA